MGSPYFDTHTPLRHPLCDRMLARSLARFGRRDRVFRTFSRAFLTGAGASEPKMPRVVGLSAWFRVGGFRVDLGCFTDLSVLLGF